MFTGFTEDTVRFFLDLRFHNETAWFHANHDRYERDVVAPFYALIEDLAPAMRDIDPRMELRPYRAISRIHRDTRFTRDKSPYRDHLWVLFRREAEPRDGAVFYWFEFGPNRLSWGLGVWGENRELFDAMRRRMAARPEEFLKALRACKLRQNHLAAGVRPYQRLAVPENIPPELNEWYRVRDFYIERTGIQTSWAYQPELTDRIRHDFEALAPMYRLLRGIKDDKN